LAKICQGLFLLGPFWILQAAKPPQAEGWRRGAEGQTEAAKPPQGRANSEPWHSPTRP